MKTINISLPTIMYQDVKQLLKNRGYSSVSELIRDALRGILYPGITVNGFTEEFEDQVLKAAKEPLHTDTILEREEDIDRFFDKIHRKIKRRRHDKNS